MALDAPHPPSDPADERLDRIRSLVVEAGLEVLDRDGLGLRSDSITYAKVFAYLEEEFGLRVTRGSVHGRIWANQDAFRTEVLSAARKHASPYENSTGMHDAVVAILEHLDRRDFDHRQRVETFCRIAGPALLGTYLESDEFRRFQAIKAAARPGDDPEATSVLQRLVSEKADGNRAERIQRFSFMFDALRLRPRSNLAITKSEAVDLFMTVIQMLITGAHLDHTAGFGTMAAPIESDLPADEKWPWTYFGFAFLAIMDFLFEEDPNADPTPSPDGYPPAAEIAPLAPPTETMRDLAALVNDRPRRTKADLRALVVAAGVQLFLRDGLRLKAESLSYTSVFAHLKQTRGITVHRSTVHNEIWSSQSEFRAEVLAEAARYGPGEALIAVHEAMRSQTVTHHPDGSVNLRQLILDNLMAMVSARMNVAVTSPIFRRWQTIKASMLSEEPGSDSDGLRQVLNTQYEDMLSVFDDSCRSLFPLVGLRINPALGMSDNEAYHLYNVICATIATGFEINTSAGAQLVDRTFPLPRADGSNRRDPWPIPAIASLAALDLLFIPADVPV